ncbi:MAG: hypothetical protein OEZ39_08175 [Gammaproteobacteria bacterium]|nr:hypothetical protein [Gammaproteobacteria bacterium]MDH5651837.1 hypothetical protein [Gammaproteobacteria bacterium]
MSIKRYTKEELEKMEDLTDYDRINNMTDDEIRKNAESDPDVPPQSEEDLARFKKVKKPKGDKS